jgi:hypothetical protein
MLRFARTEARPALRLLVLHDDAEREFAYTQGRRAALQRARDRGCRKRYARSAPGRVRAQMIHTSSAITTIDQNG